MDVQTEQLDYYLVIIDSIVYSFDRKKYEPLSLNTSLLLTLLLSPLNQVIIIYHQKHDLRYKEN